MDVLRSSTGRFVVGVVLLGVALLALAFIVTKLKFVDEKTAYLVALGVFGLAGAAFGLSQLRAARSASQLEAALRAQGVGATGAARPGQPDFEDLRKQFDESLGLLKQSRLGRGAIYKLPWFVIIGPPGSGKTTMLRESGLSFPYMTKGRAAIRGLGGTKNCDWWFADRGVLLDTAGRWTSEVEDRDEWLAFLDLLKKYRRRQPINGVVVAVSLDDVAYRNASELQKLADDVRDRIDELTRRLEMLLPVYLVFTKCDGLLGFVESFSGMNREQRAQVWGFTFPERPPQGFRFPEAFASELDQLGAQLGKRRLPQLVTEPTRRRRRLMFRLPQEFAAVRERLCQFAELIQQANPYQEASTIRGCYFTSGTQERSALGDLLTEMARKSGVSVEELEIPSGERKCYFVDDLFNRIVFEDRDLAAPTRAAGQRRRLFQWVQLAGVAIGIVALLWFEFARFLSVRDLTSKIGDYAKQVDEAANLADRLAALQKLHQLARAAETGSEVQRLLRERIARCAQRQLVGPTATRIAAGYQTPMDPPTSDRLLERIRRTGDARADLLRRRDAAKAALTGDARQSAFRPALLPLLAENKVPDEVRDATLRMFDELCADYTDLPQLWQPAEAQWTVLTPAFDEQERQQAAAERSVLEDIEKDGGKLFDYLVRSGKELTLGKLGCKTIAADGLLSTMLPKNSIPAPEGEAVIDFEENVDDKASQLKEQLAGLPIADTLVQRRNSALVAALDNFRKQILPNWRDGRWSALLRELRLCEEINTPAELYAARALLGAEFQQVVQLYCRPEGQLVDAVKYRVQTRMERLTQKFEAIEKGAQDLGALTKAVADLANAVRAAEQSAPGEWSDTLGARQGATIAEAESKLFRSIVVRQVRSAGELLKVRYGEVQTRHESLRKSFPFDAEGDDCDRTQFFEFLDRLRGVVDACRELPRIARDELRDQSMFPKPPGEFDTFQEIAAKLIQRFGGERHDVQIKIYPYNENLQSILLERDGQTLFRKAPMQPTRVVPAPIRADTKGALKIVLQTKGGESLTLANLKTTDRWLATNKSPNGLPESYWAFFRLCRSASIGRLSFIVEQANSDHVVMLELKFESPKTGLTQDLRLVLSGTAAGEEELFRSDSRAFALDFPTFPWN